MRTHFTPVVAGVLLLAGVGAAAAQDVVIQPQDEKPSFRSMCTKSLWPPSRFPAWN